ncbi:MAG: hypothetical protein Q7T82_11995 [Armatimonadota bacterium]|nr:hypothetical protein [Armatimonadota bacterium]
MDATFQVVGGANMAWMNASWPLARLSASPSGLTISAAVLGSYTFTPEQVVAIEPRGSFFALHQGIRIVHSRADCPARMIFHCFGSPQRLIEDILRTGFTPRSSPDAVPVRSRMPVRWTAVLPVVLAWNALFILNDYAPQGKTKPLGPLAVLAVAIMLCVASAVRWSPRVQAWFMKPGRSVGEIGPIIAVVQLVTAGMLIFLAVLSRIVPK